MDEWQIDEQGRRFRMIGKIKEYEMVYRIGGVEVPASQLEEFHRRNKEAAAAQRAAEIAEPKITERCPFASGASTTCKSDCALRTAHGCALVYQIDRRPATTTTGKSCPFSPYRCTDDCALNQGGCVLAAI